MITISLCMIVKNEEETLERCLQSVRDIVDEIVIVDTGSTDRTKELASKWTLNVYDFEWIHDFAAARNFSYTKATMDYILWLDADDILLPEDCEKLSKLKKSLSSEIDAVSMPYHCDFDDNGNVTLTVRRFRLVKRLNNYQWEGAVHEDLVIRNGCFYDSDIVVMHRKNYKTADPDRNIKIYEKLIRDGNKLTARDSLHFAMELHQHRLFQEAVKYYLKFLNFDNLSNENRIFACSKLADCYYHLGNRKKEREYTFKTFEYDIPRPEACCRLGYYFIENKQFSQAIFWYKTAIESQENSSWNIQNTASRTWIPHMQLGLCYFQIGEYELSYHHNKIAHYYRPDDEGISQNMQLLEDLKNRNLNDS
ncbi:glycosyltransferase [Neobacillus sp. NPDC097160]|uniref:tetratricopeptide repeat-containing glycosyltransferase family 2 protein n=1 Tax=Neobacillus sp. NPDC097160 TaxID=3364298 RepID=UPI0037FFEBB3